MQDATLVTASGWSKRRGSRLGSHASVLLYMSITRFTRPFGGALKRVSSKRLAETPRPGLFLTP
jgi:hypothetical protein